MTQLDEEVAQVEIETAAYEEMKEALERDHLGEWVVFHNRKLVESYKEFQDAATDAVRKFGRGPYLITQVGEPTEISFPPYISYMPDNADNQHKIQG